MPRARQIAQLVRQLRHQLLSQQHHPRREAQRFRRILQLECDQRHLRQSLRLPDHRRRLCTSPHHPQALKSRRSRLVRQPNRQPLALRMSRRKDLHMRQVNRLQVNRPVLPLTRPPNYRRTSRLRLIQVPPECLLHRPPRRTRRNRVRFRPTSRSALRQVPLLRLQQDSPPCRQRQNQQRNRRR